MYLGPDCWAERGDTHTLAHLANEELEPYDLSFLQARNVFSAWFFTMSSCGQSHKNIALFLSLTVCTVHARGADRRYDAFGIVTKPKKIVVERLKIRRAQESV